MGGDFLRDLVAFEDVLEGADLETVVVGDMDEHEDFILPVAVGVDETFAIENFDERIEFEVAGGGHYDFAFEAVG